MAPENKTPLETQTYVVINIVILVKVVHIPIYVYAFEYFSSFHLSFFFRFQNLQLKVFHDVNQNCYYICRYNERYNETVFTCNRSSHKSSKYSQDKS